MRLRAEAATYLLAFAVFATPLPALQDSVPVTVAEGTDSGITDARQVTIRTPEEWRTLWSAHSPEPAPPVDFSRSIVAAVFLGSRPTAGFRVEITGATLQGEQTVLRFVEHRPRPDAILAQVITAPFHIVTLPSVVRTVRFQQAEPRR